MIIAIVTLVLVFLLLVAQAVLRGVHHHIATGIQVIDSGQ